MYQLIPVCASFFKSLWNKVCKFIYELTLMRHGMMARLIPTCHLKVGYIDYGFNYADKECDGDDCFLCLLDIHKRLLESFSDEEQGVEAMPENLWEFRCKAETIREAGFSTIDECSLIDTLRDRINNAYLFQQLGISGIRFNELKTLSEQEASLAIWHHILNRMVDIKHTIDQIWIVCGFNKGSTADKLKNLQKYGTAFSPNSFALFKHLIKTGYTTT